MAGCLNVLRLILKENWEFFFSCFFVHDFLLLSSWCLFPIIVLLLKIFFRFFVL